MTRVWNADELAAVRERSMQRVVLADHAIMDPCPRCLERSYGTAMRVLYSTGTPNKQKAHAETEIARCLECGFTKVASTGRVAGDNVKCMWAGEGSP